MAPVENSDRTTHRRVPGRPFAAGHKTLDRRRRSFATPLMELQRPEGSMSRKKTRPRRPPWRGLARTGASDGLSDRQRRAIAALLSADSTASAARSSGISRRSLVRWMHDPTFREALTAASRERFKDAKDLLRAATVEAVQVLRAAQRTGAVPERLRAAIAILDLARRTETRLAADDKRAERTPPRGGACQ